MCKIKILFLFLILLSVSEIAYAEGYSYNFDDLNPGLYSNATWGTTWDGQENAHLRIISRQVIILWGLGMIHIYRMA